MAKTTAPASNSMKKWYLITGVLVVVLIIVTSILASRVATLSSKLSDSEDQVTSLESEVAGLEGDVSSLQTQLTQEKSETTALQADLTSAESQVDSLNKSIASQQSTITQQASQIKIIQYPRHFNSVIELTNWLQKDDTNTRYAGLSTPEISFILQIRAARDGYLLPVRLPIGGSLDYITNMAVIGDSVYSVRGTDDFVEKWMTISPVLPSYPITPESGQ